MAGAPWRRATDVDSTTDERIVQRTSKNLVICVCNSGYEASLEPLKVYVAPDVGIADRLFGWIRITDESGRDYLYPERNFVSVDLSPSAARVIFEVIDFSGQETRR